MKIEKLANEFENIQSIPTENNPLSIAFFELQKNDLRSSVIELIESYSFDSDSIDFYQSIHLSKHPLMLTMYSVEQFSTMRLFKLKDYNIGFALKDLDDSCEIVAVHNNEPIIKNIGKKLLQAAIRNGGNTLDHFGSKKMKPLPRPNGRGFGFSDTK